MTKIKQLIENFKMRSKLRSRSVKISPLSLIDSKTKFSSNVFIDRFVILKNVSIGSYSYIGNNSKVFNTTIGKFCSISSDVKIGMGDHPVDRISTSPVIYSNNNALKTKFAEKETFFEEYKSVEINNDVWVGANVIIKGGVRIGNGAIIGAGSIVTRDVEAYQVVGGVPAKLIKKRFSDEEIDAILNTEWWEWPEETIRSNIKELNNPKDFFMKLTKRSKV